MSSKTKTNNRDEDSSLGQSISASSITITNNTSTRRSDRLQAEMQSSSRVLHRTVSGGVANGQSPKLSSRRFHSSKRDGLTDRTSVNANRTSMATTRDSRMTDEENDGVDGPPGLVSFELSEDEMDVSSRRKPNERLRPTRSEVLSYFTEEPDGYRCNICNVVILLLAQLWIST